MKIPRIEYEVYYPLYDNRLIKLNLNICRDNKININIPILLDEKDLDKHNISSNYYKDICYKSSSENGVDLIINDRKEEYINKDMNACEENCEFEKYDLITKKAICSCDVKINLKSFSEISKNATLLLKGFKDIKNIINLNIMKCYHTLFNIDIIIKNIGSYIILSTILFNFIGIIIFFKRDYTIINNEISDIILYNEINDNECKNNKKTRKNMTKKRKENQVSIKT